MRGGSEEGLVVGNDRDLVLDVAADDGLSAVVVDENAALHVGMAGN